MIDPVLALILGSTIVGYVGGVVWVRRTLRRGAVTGVMVGWLFGMCLTWATWLAVFGPPDPDPDPLFWHLEVILSGAFGLLLLVVHAIGQSVWRESELEVRRSLRARRSE